MDVRPEGIEPPPGVYKTPALPLSYGRIPKVIIIICRIQLKKLLIKPVNYKRVISQPIKTFFVAKRL